MTDLPSSLAPHVVEPLLRGQLGRPYRFVAECDSTQELVRAGDPPEGAVVATDHQRAGRGRAGRTWEDAPGDALLFSLLLRPPTTPALPQLSLVLALAVAEAIERVTGLTTGIKWPNDVEVDGRKVAGVLLEAAGGAVTCGVGINVNQTAERLPPDTRRPSGSLRIASGRVVERARLLAEILEGIERRYRQWLGRGLGDLVGALDRRSTLVGRSVTVGSITGTVQGIASDGRLRIRRPSGETVDVDSGEVDATD